jgi:O-acetyl-ADP-ribose deacetylase (regulator of RNase III)
MGYKVICKEGDLLQEMSATFIVNASNSRLILGSGVSMAFKRACGIELQGLMFEKLREFNRELE